ncbi:heme utilization protein [Pseudomonas gingeri]|uniref:Heme utilization protein n=1 Tax=Pseudomonas gingeri TaxID=117681 RepID=A0A7Y7XDC0_9PSED|nr:heme utilization protein [Pseudomonas gingeri]NWA24697.1 heme utilization protein [Pseudomonas gingeri]NWB96687.1 heme utilization protein [Pseudomonas gingeri]NWD71540.1 heme utilization protein [Pseudomonas gingeri]NWD77995.1 heme utilization protein [Pseudomonas gingeri]
MKPTMALKPLVFALAAVMAMAAQAGGNDDGHGRRHHDHNQGPDLATLLQITAGASASVNDTQDSHGNAVINEGTQNNGSINNSLNSASGNMGANAAAGDGNQQLNEAALATADESFIFGSASSNTTLTQTNHNNTVANESTQNNGSLNSSGNYGSGNMGVNVAAGDFNQQKNDLAIAVSGGRVASATGSATQNSNGLQVANAGVQAYKVTTLKATISLEGGYSGTFKGTESSGSDGHGGWGNDDRGHGKGSTIKGTEMGTIDLNGVATYQVMTPNGWTMPVVNNASINGSLNNASGNVGANVAAGVGNQQGNTLSIAAGCRACM